MAGKVDVYNLGTKGVVLTKSPTHNDDGELSSAQNAVLDTDARVGSLRKRPGLTAVNSSALAGSVLGLVHVPLPDSTSGVGVTRTLYVPLDQAGGDSWRTSTNGTTWAGATSPTYVTRTSNLPGFDNTAITTIRGKVYFPSNDYVAYSTASHTRPPLNSWDGTTDSEILTVPLNIDAGASTNENMGSLLNAEGLLYFSTQTSDKLRVFQYNPETGRLITVGPTITGLTTTSIISDILWFEGRLWAGIDPGGTTEVGQLYSIRPPASGFTGDTSWTLEYTATGEGGIINLASYKGLLYVAQSNNASRATIGPRVKVRSSLGVYTTSETGAGGSSTGTSHYAGMLVYQSELYAYYRDNDGANSNFTYRKFDGTSWSQVADIETLISTNAFTGSKPVIFDNNMYVAIGASGASNGGVVKNASGTWTAVDTGQTYHAKIALLETGL